MIRTLTLTAIAAAVAATTFAAPAEALGAGVAPSATSEVNTGAAAIVDARDLSQSNVTTARIPVSTATAPHLWATDDTCMGSSSVGVQGLLFGFSMGTTWRDEDCVRRKDSRELYNMGNTMPALRVAALARMCQKSANIAAMHAAGLQCPGAGLTSAAETRIHGERFFGIHNDTVIEGTVAVQPVVSAPEVLDKDSRLGNGGSTNDLNRRELNRLGR